jgi:hypothetical protein
MLTPNDITLSEREKRSFSLRLSSGKRSRRVATPKRTLAALIVFLAIRLAAFPAGMKTIHAGYWKASSLVAINV